MKKRPRFACVLAIVTGILAFGSLGCSNKTELAAVESLREMATRERQVSAELSREINAHQERSAMDQIAIVILGGGVAVTCFLLVAR